LCGIAGILGPDARLQLVGRMSDAQRHRGPDDQGAVLLPAGVGDLRLALGHRRLAILDLSPAGHQPMEDPATGAWIVFNGEVYNHQELRRDLDGQYRSTGDTETLLKAFGRWGPDAIGRLRGMFAFAIWDPTARELFLCRDRLGIKPLYFAQAGRNFLFASELRAILSTGLVPRKVDPVGLNGFLAFGHVPEPGTIIQGIHLLPAGHWIRVSPERGIIEARRYWSPPFRSRGGDARRARAGGPPEVAVRRLISEAVKYRLISDVPLGAFLSGGIDSSAIVAAMARLDHRDIRTFTLDFTEPGYGEGAYAERLAERFETRHVTESVSANALLTGFDEALDAADQPSIDGVNVYNLCKLAKASGLSVALCGHGGDELFGGYNTFRLIPRALGLATVPAPFRSLAGRMVRHGMPIRVATRKASSLLSGSLDAHEIYALARSVFWDDFRGVLLERPGDLVPGAEFVRATVSRAELADDPHNMVSQFELGFYLRNSLLRDADVHSMAHAMELRVPLIDHKLVEHVAPLPGYLKAASRPPKRLLVDAMGEDLPAEIGLRRKQGFVIPYEVWMRGVLKPTLDEVLTSPDRSRAVGLRPREVAGIWAKFLQGERSQNMQHPLALFVLLRWCSQHKVTL
jgi:asparagine synthase (glutamine-hydrolysing)